MLPMSRHHHPSRGKKYPESLRKEEGAAGNLPRNWAETWHSSGGRSWEWGVGAHLHICIWASIVLGWDVMWVVYTKY